MPAYGCESCLEPLYDGLRPVLESISPAFELVLVEDHSPQGDWAVIAKLAARDPRVRGVKLTRNFGQHNAIAAGLAVADGDWVVVMDCDLQDRPEEVRRLYDKALEGFDCVRTARRSHRHARAKIATSRLFGLISGKIAGVKTEPSVGCFSVISRRVVHELRKFRDAKRNYSVQVN